MGRPREFDQDAVLGAAADLFWSHGFEATSTRDLTEATGLTPASMYNAFGDKRGLFLAAMTHYLDHSLRERIKRLEALPSPGDAIGQYFREVIDRSLGDPAHRGCLLVNTALEASSDSELRKLVADETRTIEAFFHRMIVAGQKRGEIPAALPATDAARNLLAMQVGLRVLVRVRPEEKLLTGLVRSALAQLNLRLPPRSRSA